MVAVNELFHHDDTTTRSRRGRLGEFGCHEKTAKIMRFLLLCCIGYLLATASGCAWAAVKLWGYTLENHSAETVLNVEVARAGQLRPLGPGAYVFPSGAGDGDYVGVIGQIPEAVNISFTSKDKRHHRVYVVIPPRPGGYGSESPNIYFVLLSRCSAIATWQNPDTKRFQFFWSYARRKNGTAKFSDAKLILGDETVDLWMIPSGTTHVDIPKPGSLRDMDVSFRSQDGRRHQVHVVLPVPVPLRSKRPVDIHLFIASHDKVIARETQLPLKVTPRWFCAVGDNGRQAFSNLTVTAHGKSYPLDRIGPKSDASLSALGPMPKALTVGFTSPDGKRHKVRVQAAAASTFRGSKTPELYILIGTHAKLTAGWSCPPLLKYKPPPHWTCSISYTGAGTISHVTIAYHGTPPYTVADVIGTIATGLTMNPEGIAPKAVDIGFTTSNGKRHTVHLILPPFHGSGQPSFTLTIEKGGKVLATSR